ncbi:MAG: GxxExxY protein [Acidobacteriota bacterium]|nr:GxxExxY protein [Acidobacteriota bacterium]
MLTRTTPACSPEVEALVTRTIGCALRVHQALGPGYTEGLYHDAMAIDLALEGLRYEREVSIRVMYRGQPLRPQRLDLVVDGQVVVELKAVERLDRIHQAQLLSYLKSGGFKVGLLMNFHSEFLKSSLRRFVL